MLDLELLDIQNRLLTWLGSMQLDKERHSSGISTAAWQFGQVFTTITTDQSKPCEWISYMETGGSQW